MPTIGPHGIDLSIRRGVKHTRILGKSDRVNAALKRAVSDETAKQRVNATRSASRRDAAQ